jgi:hypothetical protein
MEKIVRLLTTQGNPKIAPSLPSKATSSDPESLPSAAKNHCKLFRDRGKKNLILARSQTSFGFGRSWYERTDDGVKLAFHTEPRGFSLWRSHRIVASWNEGRAA